MKPTDPNTPPENATDNSQNSPVFSRLRRVVDMTELNQHSRTKTQPGNTSKHSSHKPDHAASPNNQAARSDKQKHNKAQHGPKHPTSLQARHASHPQNEKLSANAADNQPQNDSAELPDVELHPINDTQYLSADSVQKQPAGDSSTQLPAAASPETDPITIESAPKPIKNKHRSAGLRLSEKHSIGKREHIKATKQLARQIKSETSGKTNQISEKIDEALMLQSWRAKLWSACIASLSPAMAIQLPKCMPLVQARLVNNLCITCGRLEATVVEQVVSISLRQFTMGQWRTVISMLSDKAIFTTSLLNGELPEGILDVFKQSSLSLFPTKQKEFSFSCDCDTKTFPCEHICALLLAFAQALEEDPFHILTLRGMTPDMLLSQLRDARSDQVVDEKNRHHINYEMPAQNVDFSEFFNSKGQFSELNFHIACTPNTLIRRLGSPACWQAPVTLCEAVMPIIDIAAHEAESLAMCEQLEIASSPEDSCENTRPPLTSNRAPRNTAHSPRFSMPDMSFIKTVLSPEILETLPDDPVATAEDIIRWLKTRGASDIRTLARRTRLHKPTIEAFLNAFCDAGLTTSSGEPEKLRFEVTF